jgi:branched-chain amino acid transport system substrate-binding protein
MTVIRPSRRTLSKALAGTVLLPASGWAQAPARGPARVELLLPLSAGSEDVRAEAKGLADAARLAVEEAAPNGAGPVSLNVVDTRGEPDVAAQAARAARDAGARLVLGPLFAAEARAVGAAVPDLPVISFSNDRTVARRGLYVAGFQPETEVGAVAAFARASGFGPVSVFGPAGPLHERVRAALAVEGDLQVSATYASGAREDGARRLLDALLAKRPSVTPVVYLTAGAGDLVEAAVAVQAASRSLGAVQLAGGAAMAEAALRTPERLAGAWWTSPDPVARRGFEARYRRRFDRAPERLAGLGYDGAFLAATLSAEGGITQASVERRNGFLGVDGLFRFGADGVVERALAVVQATPGGPYVLRPAARVFA